MKLPKLTAIFLCLSIIFITSCKSTEEVEQDNTYFGTISMTGSQETPPVTTSATGTIDANYNRLSKTLSYTVTFSGLSDSAVAAHIHGVGEVGILAPVMQTFNNFPRRKAGTYTGSLFIDGVKFTEADLLAQRYYVNIHSKTYTGGEIRGQLILNKK
ncbi:MAG TPA: CHRD domain-containing protein [Chitinophagaceae bacterium]|nr:CHRD domain-containing protein [Chitinophagaceae bacterium]